MAHVFQVIVMVMIFGPPVCALVIYGALFIRWLRDAPRRKQRALEQEEPEPPYVPPSPEEQARRDQELRDAGLTQEGFFWVGPPRHRR